MAPAPEPRDRPDALFALVAGLYAAAILSPVGAAAAAGRVADGPAVSYGVLLGVATAATALGAILVRRQAGLAERLGDTWRAWLLVAGPAVFALLVLGGREAVGAGLVQDHDLLVAMLGGFAGAVLGFVLVSMAKTRYVAWVVDEEQVEAVWRAPWPPTARRRVWYGAGTVVAVGAVTFVAGALLDHSLLRIVGQILVPLGAVLVSLGRRLTYRVTPEGLEIRAPVARRLVPWTAFEGYELDGDTLLLVRPQWYRLSLRSALADIEDLETVLTALDAHLHRLS